MSMVFSQLGAGFCVQRSLKFFVLFSVSLLVSCLSDEASKVDGRVLAGAWAGETGDVSWCIEFTEDLRYRRMQYDSSSESVISFESGIYELQRGKRILIAGNTSNEDEFRNWIVHDKASKHRNLFVVTDVSDNEMITKVLIIHPNWTAGVENISQRVVSCESKIGRI